MGYVALTSAEVQVDYPVNTTMMTKIKDNFDYLFSNSAGGVGINNPSFEVDADADKIPDNWTKTLFSGGAASITTVSSYVNHGANAFKFTHPGGNGNGGGQLKSDYVGCSTNQQLMISFSLLSTPANCRSKVRLDWYNNGFTTIGETTIFDSSALTTAYTNYCRGTQPPTSAKWLTVALIGGTTESTVAGAVYFDNIDARTLPPVSSPTECGGNIIGGSLFESSATAINTTLKTLDVKQPGSYRLKFVGREVGSPQTIRVLRNATILSTFVVTATDTTCVLDITDCLINDLITLFNTGSAAAVDNVILMVKNNGFCIASTSSVAT